MSALAMAGGGLGDLFAHPFVQRALLAGTGIAAAAEVV